VHIFQHQCNLFPFETLFYILFDDNVITDDVVTERLGFNPFLTTFLPSLWGHHSCPLARPAKCFFGEMCVLMLSASSLGQKILRLTTSDVFLLGIVRDELVQLLTVLSVITLGFGARLRGRHCEQLLQVLILLKLFLWIDLASVIQNRDMTFNLELDNNFVIGTDENRFAIGRPDEAIAYSPDLHTYIVPTESTAGV
jgi:hypothetical protein